MRSLTPTYVENVSRLFGATWLSQNDDPYLVYDIAAGSTGFVVFYLKLRSGHLAPRLYFDDGNGFHETASITLQALDRGIYHIPLIGFPNLVRLRFDPATSASEFTLRAFLTDSAILTGLAFFLLNKNVVLDEPSKKKTDKKGLLQLAREAPKFFAWIRTPESLFSRARPAALEQFRADIAFRAAQDLPRVSRLVPQGVAISFVSPTYNTNPAYLFALVDSFLAQASDQAELIFSDDGSSSAETLEALLKLETASPNLRVIYNDSNQGISAATNAGLKYAKGQWVSFIDHDDAFAPRGLDVIIAAISAHPEAKIFYTDEYIADESLKIIDIFCKPAFDSVLLSGMNYINHLVVYRAVDVALLEGFRSECDGSQDFDMLLRSTVAAAPGTVVHIPYPAYIWRRANDTFSTSFQDEAVARGRVAIQNAYASLGHDVEIGPALVPTLHRVTFLKRSAKRVSVIIPNRDSFRFIDPLVLQLTTATDYLDIELVIVDNGSTDPHVLDLYARLRAQNPSAHIMQDTYVFNFSKMCNLGAAVATGDILLFLNNDIEITEPHWLSEMVSCLEYAQTGIVGAKLLYPDRSIQHNGVIVGLGATAGHWFHGADELDPGPMGRFYVRQSLSAVTGACLLATRACYNDVGGFDEDVFPIAYNDVDFCLKATRSGYRIVWTPFAVLIHHESQSRGLDEKPEHQKRFSRDKQALQARYHTDVVVDDAYTPCYGRWTSVPTLYSPAVLPRPRTGRFS